MRRAVRIRVTGSVAALMLALMATPAAPADDTKARQGAQQVESGARQIGQGVQDTAKGIGKTVVEGAKYTGEKFKDAGKAAEPQAKTAWENTRDGAVAFGHSVKNFFQTLFTGK